MKSFFLFQNEQRNTDWETEYRPPLKGLESRRAEKQWLDGAQEKNIPVNCEEEKIRLPRFYFWPKTF